MSASILKCVDLLQSSPTDRDKLTALMMVTKLLKASDCSADDRCRLFSAIGFDYIQKMLTCKALAGCPPDIFKSIALTILGCFAQEECVGGSDAMALLVPVICTAAAGGGCGQQSSMISADDVMQCLHGAVAGSRGRRALCTLPALRLLVQCACAVEWNGAGSQRARHVLAALAAADDCHRQLWCGRHSDPPGGSTAATDDDDDTAIDQAERATLFNQLMDTLVEELCYDVSEPDRQESSQLSSAATELDDAHSPLAVCAELRAHLLVAPPTAAAAAVVGGGDDGEETGQDGSGGDGDECVVACEWRGRLLRTLARLLVARLAVPHRVQLVALAAATLHALGVDNTASLIDCQQRHLFVVTTNLLCVEVRMSVEERTLREAMVSADTLCVGFMFLEKVLCSLVNDECPLKSDSKQQLTAALRGALTPLTTFVKCVGEADVGEYSERERTFILACVRVILAWLSEESSYSSEVLAALPYLLQVCTPPPPATNSNNNSRQLLQQQEEVESVAARRHVHLSLLRLFLPSLCHLTANDDARPILISCSLDVVLVQYLQDRWDESDSLLACLSTASSSSDSAALQEFEQTLTTACSCLLNIAVLEPDYVAGAAAFTTLLRQLLRRLPSVHHTRLLLHSHLLVLALMLVHRAVDAAANGTNAGGGGAVSLDQSGVVRLMQAAVRFVWEALSVTGDDGVSLTSTSNGSSNGNGSSAISWASLTVSSRYRSEWSGQLQELWLLTLQLLAQLLAAFSWLAEFVMESGWPAAVVDQLRRVRHGHAGQQLLGPLQTVLTALCRHSAPARAALAADGALAVCRTHRLRDLARALND